MKSFDNYKKRVLQILRTGISKQCDSLQSNVTTSSINLEELAAPIVTFIMDELAGDDNTEIIAKYESEIKHLKSMNCGEANERLIPRRESGFVSPLAEGKPKANAQDNIAELKRLLDEAAALIRRDAQQAEAYRLEWSPILNFLQKNSDIIDCGLGESIPRKLLDFLIVCADTKIEQSLKKSRCDEIAQNMPHFTLLAKDNFTLPLVRLWISLAAEHPGTYDKRKRAETAYDEILSWRLNNQDRCKFPD